MPPNSPQTLLPLESFREICGAHPYFFWQLSNKKIPLTDSSDALFVEKTWQKPMASSRSDIRVGITKAEQQLQTALGYDVATRYRSEGYPKSRLINSGNYGWAGWRMQYGNTPFGSSLLNLNVGKLQRIATVSYSKLADVVVNRSDSDGDGLDDTFIGTFTDSTSDPDLVIVAFRVEDQPANYVTDESTGPVDWQIRPCKVKRLNDATLQISGPAWLLVKPTLYEHAPPAAGYNNSQVGVDSSGALDPEINTNFVASVAAWLKVYSNEGQATLVRRSGGTETTYQVTATIADAEKGLVAIDFCGCYDTSECCLPAQEEIRVNYEAGATNQFRQAQYLQFQTDWDVVVAHFAIAQMAQIVPINDRKNSVFSYYQMDLALIANQAGGQGFRVSNDILYNGFKNTRRGAVEAWQAVVTLAPVRAINIY